LRNEGSRRVHFRTGTDCPPEVSEAAAGLFDAEHDGTLLEGRFGELERFMTMASKCGHELRAYDDALDFVAGRRDADRRASGYVSFHGGVPSEKRPALIERFRNDPTCRVFLSTDAGSTGLNLQHASTLVNMDLPWNPAILEQRIARIQARPVRVINFVAKGTIEEGMLSVLAFKRSLSAGILDGGSGEISLGGSRLNRFMKDVESVTGSMGEGEAMTPAEEVGRTGAAAGDDDDDAGSAEDMKADVNVRAGEVARTDGFEALPRDAGSDPWQALVQVGAQFIAALAAANDPKAAAHPWIERDPASGAQNLKMPLPPPETTRQLANVLSALADGLRGKET
jgi:hypothetical protein